MVIFFFFCLTCFAFFTFKEKKHRNENFNLNSHRKNGKYSKYFILFNVKTLYEGFLFMNSLTPLVKLLLFCFMMFCLLFTSNVYNNNIIIIKNLYYFEMNVDVCLLNKIFIVFTFIIYNFFCSNFICNVVVKKFYLKFVLVYEKHIRGKI